MRKLETDMGGEYLFIADIEDGADGFEPGFYFEDESGELNGPYEDEYKACEAWERYCAELEAF